MVNKKTLGSWLKYFCHLEIIWFDSFYNFDVNSAHLTQFPRIKLEFVANRSASGRTSSDIAIDDIAIEDEPCILFF